MTVGDYENRILRFYFLLHRDNISESSKELHLLLKTLKYDLEKGDTTVYVYLRTLYEMIGHTRDIYFGRGERDLSYMMIFVWYSYFPDLAFYAFQRLVIPIQDGTHTYPSFGCWKDVKYFCKHVVKEAEAGIQHPFIGFMVSLANWQLKRDKDRGSTDKMSNVAKWIPRETKDPLLYEQFVMNWFDKCSAMEGAAHANISFMKKKYRTIISNLCKQLTLSVVSPMQSTNYHLCNRANKSQNEIIHGISRNYMYDTIFIGEYVEMAVKLYESGDSSGREWLDQKWEYLKKALFFKRTFSAIPIVDMSIQISNKDLFHSIGFACLIAELFGTYRVLFVSTIPLWIDISEGTFYEKIVKMWSVCKFRGESKFSRSLDMVFETLDKTMGLSANASCGPGPGPGPGPICFFVFSDTFWFDWENMSSKIGPGIRFVFWKIGAGSIPQVHIEDSSEIMYVSGNSACLLKTCIEEIPNCYHYIYRFMNCSRYACLTHYFDNFWDNQYA